MNKSDNCDFFTNDSIPKLTFNEKHACDKDLTSNWRPITLLNLDYKLLTKSLGNRFKKVLPSLIEKDHNGFVPGGSIFLSAHTVRNILCYCKKENVDLILLALDYTKAFDSLDFEFIKETFQVFCPALTLLALDLHVKKCMCVCASGVLCISGLFL